MKNLSYIPVANSISLMHRVFGDPVIFTDIHRVDNRISDTLMKSGLVEIKYRLWYRSPTRFSRVSKGEIVKRYECYYDGILVDYTLERSLILKTFNWLLKHGQIHTEA